jgi:hypothetical protein
MSQTRITSGLFCFNRNIKIQPRLIHAKKSTPQQHFRHHAPCQTSQRPSQFDRTAKAILIHILQATIPTKFTWAATVSVFDQIFGVPDSCRVAACPNWPMQSR